MPKPICPTAESSVTPAGPSRVMGGGEFILFFAASLIIGAMATDLFLPALADIGGQLTPHDPGAAQAAIATFLVGMGCAQLIAGPVADHHGCRAVALMGTAVFVVGGALASQSADMTTLGLARVLQGFGAGTLRVATMSMLRDRHHGSSLARVTSLAMSLLLLEPIVGPMLGQGIVVASEWRMVPMLLAFAGAGLFAWIAMRQPESGAPRTRSEFALQRALGAYRVVIANRSALACMLAYALVMGAHVGFLTSAQAIFRKTFGEEGRFTILLALVSIAMAVASLVSALLVRRYRSGVLVVAALAGLVVANSVALAALRAGWVGLPEFIALQGANMFAFGMLAPNLTALSMNDFAAHAGTAASVFGCLTTVPAALLGLVIARICDGGVGPLFEAYLVLGSLALLLFSGTFRQKWHLRPGKA